MGMIPFSGLLLRFSEYFEGDGPSPLLNQDTTVLFIIRMLLHVIGITNEPIVFCFGQNLYFLKSAHFF